MGFSKSDILSCITECFYELFCMGGWSVCPEHCYLELTKYCSMLAVILTTINNACIISHPLFTRHVLVSLEQLLGLFFLLVPLFKNSWGRHRRGSYKTSPYEYKFSSRENVFRRTSPVTLNSMADPGFPRGGVPTYYLANFPKNCVKMKTFWARRNGGVQASLAPSPSANALLFDYTSKEIARKYILTESLHPPVTIHKSSATINSGAKTRLLIVIKVELHWSKRDVAWNGHTDLDFPVAFILGHVK